MNVLGINPGHNGSVCLIIDGEVVLYIEEERLSRNKYDGYPILGIDACLAITKDIDHLVLGGTSRYASVPWNGGDYYTAYLKKRGVPDFKVHEYHDSHHFGHAANAFYGSGFDEAVALVVDGAGSYTDGSGFEFESMFSCTYDKIQRFYTRGSGSPPFNTIGIVKSYEAITNFIGHHFIEAGKTMGLSVYGNPHSISLYDGMEPRLDTFEPHYPAGATLRQKDLGSGEDLAASIQEVSSRAVLQMIREAVEISGINNVVLSGGYGLNCVANNMYLGELDPDIKLYVDPLSHDGGTSMGLAKHVYNRVVGGCNYGPLRNLYLGPKPDLDTKQVTGARKTTGDEVAAKLADGDVIAIFQGRSEAGPRALGNRSILFNPTDPQGRDRVNSIKNREWYRPFAATILEGHASDWFDMHGLEMSPFMMYALRTKDGNPEIPAVCHVDGTCRAQTVNWHQNKEYYNLIAKFSQLSGVPLIGNTSFNIAGEPLVETVGDAISTLNRSEIDHVYFPELGVLL